MRYRNALVERHRRLARRVAWKYADRGAPVEDLFQEGAIGLIGAAETFEPARRVSFSTYAVGKITSRIVHYLRDRSGTIHRAAWATSLERKAAFTEAAMRNDMAREPTSRPEPPPVPGASPPTERLMDYLARPATATVVTLIQNGTNAGSTGLAQGKATFTLTLSPNPGDGSVTLSVLEATAQVSVTTSMAQALPKVDGVHLMSMEVSASLGGRSSVTYLDRAGKRYSRSLLEALSRQSRG